ncbi:MAG: hypothetical protein KGJ59_10450 [Bacteroidota bacterium]|nr:hypothetical protein [Bacteroidota bacterium]
MLWIPAFAGMTHAMIFGSASVDSPKKRECHASDELLWIPAFAGMTKSIGTNH